MTVTEPGFTADPGAFDVPFDDLGWVGTDPDAPDVVALREHLEANGGLAGMDVVDPEDVERAVKVFHRDGFVVVHSVLDDEQLDFLRGGVERVLREICSLDGERTGNRNSHRYSFGSCSITGSQLHHPEWRMLIDLPTVTPIVTAIFGSRDYMLQGSGGDVCLPGAVEYQALHADIGDRRTFPDGGAFGSFADDRGMLTIRDLPVPAICCNFLCVDLTPTNGPTRQIPGTQHSRSAIPTLDEEPEWMKLSTVCPAPAGGVLIRDVRAWHGGTPNLSDHVRAIPNVEFYAPWFRQQVGPCLERRHYEELSDHAKRVVRFSVLDSASTLRTGTRIGFNPFNRAPAAERSEE